MVLNFTLIEPRLEFMPVARMSLPEPRLILPEPEVRVMSPVPPLVMPSALVEVKAPPERFSVPAISLVVPRTTRFPFVVMLPFEVVVALPPIQRLEAMEKFVVEAFVSVVTPVTPSVPPIVVFALRNASPTVRKVPFTSSLYRGAMVFTPTLPLVVTYKEFAGDP